MTMLNAAASLLLVLSAPSATAPEHGARAVAYFAGGCFWGVEGVYEHVRGVRSVTSGYAGGRPSEATYAAVSSGRTGHAETVKIVYDPRIVSYGRLLQIFFTVVADPTQKNRQGPDIGPQYRTAIFPANDRQAAMAADTIAKIGRSGLWSRPIVTTIERGARFTPAEAHHQDFMARHPRHPYILAHDAPKVAALRRMFPADYRD